MKTRAFVDAMNSGYARLLVGEKEEERMDVKVALLNQCLGEPVEEGEILEITLSEKKELIAACKLLEETERTRKEAESLIRWLRDGIYAPFDEKQ
jgi:hypothetical protein